MPSKKTQKAVFWILTILIGLGLVASSVVWTLPNQTPAPSTPPPTAAQNTPEAAPNPADFSALEAKAKADPRDIPTRLQLAQAYRSAGEFEKAIGVYEEILRLDETNGNARLSLAEVYSALGRYDDALGELDRLLDDNPQHQAALWTAVEVLAVGKQNYQGAIARLEEYIKVVGEGPEAEQARQMIAFYRQMAEQAQKEQETKEQTTKD